MTMDDVLERLKASYGRLDASRNTERSSWDRGYHEGRADERKAVIELLEKAEHKGKPQTAQRLKDKLPMRDILEQGAEECAELGKAMLKLIRTMDCSKNPTPAHPSEVLDNVYEEIQDVLCVLMVLLPEKKWDAMIDGTYTYYKLDRWNKRLDKCDD